ncbi:MAG: MFS transporter [Bacteroidota bacterium]
MVLSHTPRTLAQTLNRTFQLYKEAYSGHPPAIWTLACITLINRAGTMVIPFLSVYLTTILGFKLEVAGLIASGFGAGSMAGAYLGGKFSDRFGARWVIFASLLMGGVFFIGLQWVVHPIAIWIMIFLTTTFGEAYRPAYSVSVGYFVPKEKTGRTMAFLRLAVNLGMSLAPAIGGFLAVNYGYVYLFWVEGITGITASFVFLYLSRNWPITRTEKTEETEQSLAESPFRSRDFLLLLVTTFFISFVFLQWFHTVPVFIKTVWHFDERYIGLMMGISSAIITLIEMPVIHSLEERGKNFQAMRIGLVFIVVSYAMFYFPGAWIVGVIAIVIWTFGEMLFLPLLNSSALKLSPDKNRGNYMAVYYMAWSLSNILAPTLGFWIIGLLGFNAFWLLLLGFGALAFLANDRIGRA